MVTKQWGEGGIVTGAAGGTGAAVATALAGSAPRIELWDTDPRVHQVAEPLGRQYEGTAARGTEIDLTDPATVCAVFDRTVAESGAPHTVVHTAGAMISGSALDTGADDWRRCLAVNTNSAVYVAQRAAREMVAAQRGSIVVVSSDSATTPRVGLAAYGAAKAATTAFTRSLALQVAPHGVRVNLVSPGSIDTPSCAECTPIPANTDSVRTHAPACSTAIRRPTGRESRCGGSPNRPISPLPSTSWFPTSHATSPCTTCGSTVAQRWICDTRG